MTPKEFAKAFKTAFDLHEASYNAKFDRYMVSYEQAADQASPKEWATVITCLLTAGYADMLDWCDEHK